MKHVKDFGKLVLIFFAAYLSGKLLTTFIAENIPQISILTDVEFETLVLFIIFAIGLGMYRMWDRSKNAQYILLLLGCISIILFALEIGLLQLP